MGSIPVGISASRGAAILGVSKYSEPVEAWLKICEDITPGFCEMNMYPKPEFVDNAATRWGNALEDHMIWMARDTVGSDIGHREFFLSHPKHKYITCHIDGSYTGTDGLHEAKTVNQRTFRSEWGEPGTERIPRAYMVQVQHQMMLSDQEQCIVSALVLPKMQDEFPDPECLSKKQIYRIARGLFEMGYFHQYPIKRNQKLIDLMLEKYVDFWNENVLKKIPPKPQSFDWVKKMIPKPSGTIIADEQIQRWSTELAGLKMEAKAAKKRETELKKLILDYMRVEADRDDVCIDDESTERLLLLAPNGYKMHSFNGKMFR